MVPDPARAVDHVLAQLRLVERALHFPAVIIITGITADRRQTVRRQCQETGDTESPRDVLHIGVQAAVLMHDQHGRERTLAGGHDKVTAHFP